MLDINGVGQGDHAAVLGAEFGPDPERTLWNGDDDGARRDRSVGEPSLLVRQPQPAGGVAPELGLHPAAAEQGVADVGMLYGRRRIADLHADLGRGVPRHVAAACGDRVDDRLGGKRFGADDRVGRGDVAAAVEVGRSDGEFAVAAHEQGMP